MLHATNDQAPARPQHKKRDADDFAADIRARQAAPAIEQTGLNDTARTADDFAADTAHAQLQHDDGLNRTTHPTNDQIIAQAHEAAERLIAGHEWQDWVAVGRALRIGRSHALYEAGTNKPEGKKYAASFARWLTEHKLDQIADKATRCRLLELMDHIDQVEIWRKTLASNKRLSINHPITVWKHWQRSKVVPDPNKAQKPSPVRTAQTKPHRISGGRSPAYKKRPGAICSPPRRARRMLSASCETRLPRRSSTKSASS